ncbi:MAG TPA: GAF domain-containing protein [Candidatus Limnocylindria bacterium]|nr:GAF domain-containing protein [Candidatus Limnocylindria bacterium]
MTVLPQGSSSSSADVRGTAVIEIGHGPRRFERAITWTRVAGAIAALLIAPLLPNLGIGYILALSGFLIAWAALLHLLSGRASTAADQAQLSKVAFVGDCIVIFLGMLAITPEPNWMLFPLFAVLFIITAAFRLGDIGAGAATLVVSLEFVGLAIWREQALGLPIQLPYLAFILVLYCLTALIVSAMIREVGVMRRERTALIRDASDADDLRRADAERRELLDRERAARADAEIATARLEALQRITDAALARSALDDQLPEMLRRIMPVFDARAAFALVPAHPAGSFAVRAAVGLEQMPRASVRVRGGDAERAIQAHRPMAILDLSAAELDALVGAPVQASIVAPLHAEGELVGLLYLACERGHTFTPDELGLLRLIAERVAGAIDRAGLLESERSARAAAEAAEGRMRLLLEAGETLGEQTAVERRLEQIARLAVPKLADFCAIDLLETDGSLRRVALAALDVDTERANWAVASRYRRDPLGTHPVWDVLRDARPVIWREVDPDRLQRLARNSDHLRRLLERGICAWMGVPLLVLGQVRGSMSFTNAESQRRFAPEDVATAEELAGRVAAAIARSPSDTIG